MAKSLSRADLHHVHEHAAPALEAMAGGHLFLTGGTGFFGKWLLESLLHANSSQNLNIRVTVLTRQPNRFQGQYPHLSSAPEITLLAGDVRDFVCRDLTFTHFIHAATEASAALNSEAPLEMFDVCVAGTRRVLELARECGQPRFLLVSSGAVYGPQNPAMSHVSEEYPGGPDILSPGTAYAEGKRAAEWLGGNAFHQWNLPVVTARAFAFLGPHLPLDTHFAAGNFVRDGLRGGLIKVGGDGTPLRSYLYAADLAAWLWILLQRGEAGRAYNVGSDEAVSIAQLARKVAHLCPGTAVQIAKSPAGDAPPARYLPSIARARGLGLNVWLDLDEALRRHLDWLRS